MTVFELVRRDYKRSKINYLRAKEKANVKPDEVDHLEELMKLREEILRRIKNE